jgi:DNA-directed RNA polymerase beta subunit
MFNPVHIASEQDFDANSKKYALEIFITFENFHIYRPQIHEINGAIKLMFPQEARLRNFTYSAATTVDMNIKYIVRNGSNLENTQIFYKNIPRVHIGKLPIMLKSNICVLNQYKHFDNSQTGECKFDAGGYFIINGSEKTVLGQERAAENRVYCFNIEKNDTKYIWKAEIKSVPDFKCISPKQISMFISSKNNGFGFPIVVEIPRIKQAIPLFIVFRALGVLSDREICEKILLDINDTKNKKLLEALQASVIESDKCLTQQDCIKYITSFVMYTPINMDKETGIKKKNEFTLDILNNDLFPHCHNMEQKIYFLGYMANKLLMAYFDIIKQDDRDSYLNKRVDGTGTLLNNLYRNYFNKLVKDMEKQVIREINTGSWRSKDDYENIINLTNIYKIIKSATIENGIKRALSTGDFGIKHSNSNKVGVAQVYNRLNYVSSLSHARRISTPTDKSGKLIPPRKLHNTTWGFLCPAECFDPETQILMWNGTFKRAACIEIGDVLVDDNGNLTTVRTTCSGFKNMYDIIPDKKNFMRHRVTDNHILTLKIRGHKTILNSNTNRRNYTHIVEFLDRNEMKFKEKYYHSLEQAKEFLNKFDDDDTIDITIEDYLKLDKRTKDRLVLFKTEGINWDKKCVEMDPYLLGLWLGDGLSDGTGFALNYKTDKETLLYWEYWAEKNGALIKKGRKYSYSVVSKKNCEAKLNGLCNRVEEAPLKKYLNKYNLLNNKHIPNEYITNDRDTRLKVLAGLIDTDGNVRDNGHEIRICQGPANFRVIYDAYTLAMSLGFCCGVTEGKSQWTDTKTNEKKFSIYKELRITGYNIDEIPTLLPRKKLRYEKNDINVKRSKSFLSSKFKLCEAGIGPYVGWQLEDKRGRFCLKDGLVTHNTPEGQSVGVVKNLAYMTHLTIYSNSLPLYEYIMPNIKKIDEPDLTPEMIYDKVKVFINGAWVGISESPQELYWMLKEKKSKGIINIYTSIIFDYKLKEIRVCNDSGRLTRPLLRVKNRNLLINNTILNNIKNGEYNWDNLLTSSKIEEAVLEYIDPEEQSWSMIATTPKELINVENKLKRFTHCEIHPSTIFGVLASCIPFPEHNQSPRNTYQCLDINETVLLTNGLTIAIKDVKIGDEVLCFNPLQPHILSKTIVIDWFIIPNLNPVMKLGLQSGREIIATDDHKFMTLNGWCQVKDMNTNITKIAVMNNSEIVYDTLIYLETTTDRFVADITVESEHHSFITTGGILSSNCAQGKQAMGVYVTNYENRMDKTAYILNYPMRPLVETRIMDLIHLNKIPSGSQLIVAIMTHTGYNQEDSLLINKGSVDRGMALTTVYHTEKDEDKQKINGDEEIRCKPDPNKTKGLKMGNYNKINSKGVIPEDTLVENRDIIISKITPIKENRNDHTKVIKYEDQSKIYKTVEETYIDKNYIDRNGEGYNFAKVRIRTVRKPVIGDKFSSRHGQKGTVGNIIPECDMPYTQNGVRPDIIINPHAIPSRMTIGQLKETVLGKVLVELGLFGDGTAFGDFDVKEICDLLLNAGYEAHGNELLYNGLTGEQVECSVFMGPVFYQRLKHMVNDKAHSRSIGPMVNLTRQPAEGRSRDGGLRFGEMERDCEHGDTIISLTNGLGIKIKDMEDCENEVLGWSEKSQQMISSKQIGFIYKGERECVEITMQDGRTNICTPEHPILNSNNEWIKAKDLKVGGQYVKSGITYPLANIYDEIKECNGWQLTVGNLIFKTDTKDNYIKALIFAKFIGYLITDGNIYKNRNSYNLSIFLGHIIDVNNMIKDLELLCISKQVNFKYNNLYNIRIPAELGNQIIKLDGLLIGNKINQPATLPSFILDPSCPKPIIREFLGGLFGGDGHSCVLGLHRGKRDILSSVSFSQTKTGKYLDSLTKMMEDIKFLLSKFDIYKITIQNPKETTYSKNKFHDINEKTYQIILHLEMDELISFHDKIGFRYCCHKSQRLEAAVSYKRLRNKVIHQHEWIVAKVDELTNFSKIKRENPNEIVPTKKAIDLAVNELKKIEPLIHEYAIPTTHDITDHLIKGTKFGSFRGKGFPTAEEYLKEIGALEWFLDDKSQCYGVNRNCQGLPTMNLKVIDIRPAGIHKVYDIEVAETHSFLANGIVAHNCMVSHGAARFTRGRMYDSSDKYSVYICKKCGLIASYNDKMHIHLCHTCGNRADFAYVEIPYACKLLFQELNTMNIAPRLLTEG